MTRQQFEAEICIRYPYLHDMRKVGRWNLSSIMDDLAVQFFINQTPEDEFTSLVREQLFNLRHGTGFFKFD